MLYKTVTIGGREGDQIREVTKTLVAIKDVRGCDRIRTVVMES